MTDFYDFDFGFSPHLILFDENSHSLIFSFNLISHEFILIWILIDFFFDLFYYILWKKIVVSLSTLFQVRFSFSWILTTLINIWILLIFTSYFIFIQLILNENIFILNWFLNLSVLHLIALQLFNHFTFHSLQHFFIQIWIFNVFHSLKSINFQLINVDSFSFSLQMRFILLWILLIFINGCIYCIQFLMVFYCFEFIDLVVIFSFMYFKFKIYFQNSNFIQVSHKFFGFQTFFGILPLLVYSSYIDFGGGILEYSRNFKNL